MTDDRPNFEVLTVEEVRRRYQLWGVKAELVTFDEDEVPAALKRLIPLARVWGIGDDVLREDMVAGADPSELNELKRAVSAVDDDLSNWLTSPLALAKLTHLPT
jgi:hypothetical protein